MPGKTRIAGIGAYGDDLGIQLLSFAVVLGAQNGFSGMYEHEVGRVKEEVCPL